MRNLNISSEIYSFMVCENYFEIFVCYEQRHTSWAMNHIINLEKSKKTLENPNALTFFIDFPQLKI